MTEVGVRTDKGRVREANEDSYGLDSLPLNAIVLSDGMGGLDSGEVASRIAVDTVLAHCRMADENPSLSNLLQSTSMELRKRRISRGS